ncbi:MAG: ACP S-malonyltransferase [Holophagae bacterium]|jgi:[acyl-carrier-protein] S-malonyltransferase
MARVAALFPGQGSQNVGMGRDLADRWPIAAGTFADIDRGLDVALSALCWTGPDDELRLTTNTQPALLTHSVAAWRVLSEHGFQAEAVAGHSLGEYSAVVAAGGLGAVDAARAVRERGRLMQQAVPVGQGAMAAILGLVDDQVVAVCRDVSSEVGEPVVAANFNSPGQVVVAGTVPAVDRAIEVCRERGARRALPLPVSAPFHSPLMAPARVALEPTLRGLDFAELDIPVYRNVDAAPVRSPDDVRDGLIRQVDAPVLWTQTVERLRADGFDTFVEVGAGTVLCGLVKRVDRSATCYPAGTVEDIEKVVAELVG